MRGADRGVHDFTEVNSSSRTHWTPHLCPSPAVIFHRGMTNPKPLDDLLGEAKSHAEFSMRHAGNVPPTMFAMTAEGLLQFLPARFDARSYAAFSMALLTLAG